ncbi:MAG: hypothetical protein ACYSW3_29625 [Planctomycetota bacterium]|jgi:hypothetical protein
MATTATKAKKTDGKGYETNSKGFRKGYDEGVKGWQVFLEAMRMHVNINQYASAISADKALIDYTLKGIAKEDKELATQDIKVPKKLACRRAMALKATHPSFNDANPGYAKALRNLVTLYDNKHIDKTGKSLISKACAKALKSASAKAKITNRLRKQISELA